MSNPIENMNNMATKHEYHGHEELFNAAWEKTNENYLIKGLKAGRKVEDLLAAMPGFKEAFSQKSLLDYPRCRFECSDGRVVTGEAKIALAGEGLLLEKEDRKILEDALAGKNITISGHESCGAAAMAYPGPDSDRYGYEGAEKLTAKTGNTYKEIHHSEFRSQIHDERALVLEGTLKFNCANWTEFPPQFLSSAAALGLSDAYIGKEVRALSGIALGDHGFGNRFNSEHPFYIIVCAKDSEQLSRLITIGQEAVKDFGDRVKVGGFVAPEKK